MGAGILKSSISSYQLRGFHSLGGITYKIQKANKAKAQKIQQVNKHTKRGSGNIISIFISDSILIRVIQCLYNAIIRHFISFFIRTEGKLNRSKLNDLTVT